MTLPPVKLDQGIHVMHLFYRINRERCAQLAAGESAKSLSALERLCAANAAPSHPRIASYAGIAGKADLGFILYAAELGQLAHMPRDIQSCFAPATLGKVSRFLTL